MCCAWGGALGHRIPMFTPLGERMTYRPQTYRTREGMDRAGESAEG